MASGAVLELAIRNQLRCKRPRRRAGVFDNEFQKVDFQNQDQEDNMNILVSIASLIIGAVSLALQLLDRHRDE